MKETETQYLKEKVLNLLEVSPADLETILEYLDHVNKVRYGKNEVTSILDQLISKGKVEIKGGQYSIIIWAAREWPVR